MAANDSEFEQSPLSFKMFDITIILKACLGPYQISMMKPFRDTAQKMKFSIKYFFSKCEQIHRKLRIWSHLLKKSLMENFIFCAV